MKIYNSLQWKMSFALFCCGAGVPNCRLIHWSPSATLPSLLVLLFLVLLHLALHAPTQSVIALGLMLGQPLFPPAPFSPPMGCLSDSQGQRIRIKQNLPPVQKRRHWPGDPRLWLGHLRELPHRNSEELCLLCAKL